METIKLQRRRKGDGSIYQRAGSPFWWIRFSDADGKVVAEAAKGSRGKKIRADAPGSRDAALACLTRRKAAVDSGEAVGPAYDRTTFADLTQGLISKLETGVLTGDNRQSSVDRARLACRHLTGFFSGEKPSRITRERIDAYKKFRLEGGAAKATLQNELAWLGQAFRLAQENGKVATMPRIKGVKAGDNARTGLLERADLDRILAHLPGHLHAPILVAWHTGWRLRSSVLTLEVGDVDLRTGNLRLRAERSKSKTEWEFPLEAGHELTAVVMAQLEANRAHAVRTGRIAPGLLFQHQGKPLAAVLPSGYVRSTLRYYWRKACVAAGLPDAIPHDLRRGFATRASDAGLDDREIMDLGGWKTPAMVARYRQSKNRHKVASVRRLMAFDARQSGADNVQNRDNPSVPATGTDEKA